MQIFGPAVQERKKANSMFECKDEQIKPST